MRLIDNMAEKLRTGLRSFLKIEPATQNAVYIREKYDFETSAARNRIWYRGDSVEIEQFFKSVSGNRTLFWAAVPTAGLELQKRHTGLPNIIIDTLSSIVLRDFNDITVDERADEWETIEKECKFADVIDDALTETLCVGDGAFKISINTDISAYPLIEFVPGDEVEYKYLYGRVTEIIFKSMYVHNGKTYILKEVQP